MTIGFPGQIWTPDYQYDPRWVYGQSPDLKVISPGAAAENIPPGVLVQMTSDGHVQIARDLTRIAGISLYDPRKYDHNVIWTQGDIVPILRRGSAFVQFQALLPPFRDPYPLELVHVYLGAGQGIFTTDTVGTSAFARGVFSIAAKDYYNTSDGSPAADVPNPVPPIPLGVTATTFGSGVALVDLN